MDHLVEERRAYHAIDSPVFQRREPREGAQPYRRGLRLDLPRTSGEPMVLALEGANAKAVRTLQLFLSEGAWADEAILPRHRQAVDQTLGEAEGVLTWDGRDVLKQGQESVGVTRQYGGAVGKRANGQVGVCLGDASRTGDTLLDRRLSWPQEWVEDEVYAARRQRCGVPPTSPARPSRRWGGR